MLYKVGVPHADGMLESNLSHQQAVHPPERELNKLDMFRLKVGRQRRIDSADQFPQLDNLSLDSGLRMCKVVLDTVQ